MKHNLIAFASLTTVLFITGCANTNPAGTLSDAGKQTSRSTPSLKVDFKCGECKPRAEIAPAISKGYADAAAASDTKIDSTKTRTLVVTEYRERSDAARFLVGALAGPDKITASLDTPQGTKGISDSALTGINGIEDVARNVGEEAFKAMNDTAASQ